MGILLSWTMICTGHSFGCLVMDEFCALINADIICLFQLVSPLVYYTPIFWICGAPNPRSSDQHLDVRHHLPWNVDGDVAGQVQ